MSGKAKMKIKTGDKVLIIAGKDKGERGRVIAVDPKKQLVMVEGLSKDKDGNPVPLNAVTKHRKPRSAQEQGMKLRLPGPLHASKVMLLDPRTDEPTRVGRRIESGKIVRYAKKSKETIDVD